MSSGVFSRLEEVIRDRRENPREGSYVCRLLDGGVPLAARKVGEEAVELVVASMENDRRGTVSEAADLMFHTLVLLHLAGVPLDEVTAELETRFGKPGLREK